MITSVHKPLVLLVVVQKVSLHERRLADTAPAGGLEPPGERVPEREMELSGTDR